MQELMLFTDGSVDSQSKIGYGAYLVVSEFGIPLTSLKQHVKVKRFEQTSSTKLELQTLLWALNEIKALASKVVVYTDSQNIIGLPRRRDRFERNNYISKNNKPVNHRTLYKAFYDLIDQLDCELVKVKGHLASAKKEEIDTFFALVDKASRNALKRFR